ncbi:MAG: hypothetical protein ACKVQK_09460 [Burkholderiales bacterium]
MAKDLIAALAQFLRDVRRHVVDRGVHLRFDGDTQFIEHLEQAPHANTVAIVAPSENRVARCLVRRGNRRALARTKAESLDVERNVDGEPLAARPGIIRALGDIGVGITAVGAQHLNAPR